MRRTEVTVSVKNLGISRVKSWESRMRIRKILRVENENERSQNKIESWDREWDESFPWESQFRDRDESLAEVWNTENTMYFSSLIAKNKSAKVLALVACFTLHKTQVKWWCPIWMLSFQPFYMPLTC